MHAAGLSRSPRAVAISAGGVLAMGVLAALAVRADSQAPSASPWLTAIDPAVGLAFVVAGLAARGPIPERVLVAAVGPAWLAGSFLSGAAVRAFCDRLCQLEPDACSASPPTRPASSR
jgi:hypothetical protein